MKKIREDMIFGVLFFILLLQLYIIFVKNPLSIVKESNQESKILLQGKDPGVPMPTPGDNPSPQQQSDNQNQVMGQSNSGQQIIRDNPIPMVPVSFGEGAPVPQSNTALANPGSAPGSMGEYHPDQKMHLPGAYYDTSNQQGGTQPGVSPQSPILPGTNNQNTVFAGNQFQQNTVLAGNQTQQNTGTFQGSQSPPPDPYHDLLVGIIILEKEPGLAITPNQAASLLKIIQEGEELKTAVPDAQKLIQEILTDTQMKYLEKKRLSRGSLTPESPAKLLEDVNKAILAIGGR